MNKLDDCAKQTHDNFVASAKTNTLVPSMAAGMSTYPAVERAITDAVSKVLQFL
jgi:glucose/mannose transport system substrate-binding protein